MSDAGMSIAGQVNGGTTTVAGMLADIVHELSSVAEPADRIRNVLRVLCQLVPNSAAALGIWTDDWRVFYCPESADSDELEIALLEHYRALTGGTEPAQVARLTHGSSIKDLALQQTEVGSGSFLSLPVVGADTVLGILQVYSDETEAFSLAHLSVVSVVAGQLGSYVALLRAQAEEGAGRQEVQNLRRDAEPCAQETATLAAEAIRRAEQAGEAQEILRALMDYIPEGIVIADAPDVTIRMVSRYGLELAGRRREDLEGISMDQLAQSWGVFRPDGVTPASDDELPLVRAVKRGEVASDEEWILRRPSGEMIPLLCNAGPIRDSSGSVVGGILAFRDMRAIKAVHQALESEFLRQQKIAETLQRALMRDQFTRELPGYGIAGTYKAALREPEVGGDFYDVFDLPDGRVALVMGDVSGKGLEAAIFTAMAKYTLRAYAYENPEPGYVMGRLNDALCEYTPQTLFITVFYSVLDPAAGTLVYANAGHDEPLYYSARLGCAMPLDITGRATGVLPASTYGQRTLTLEPDDVLLVYTDGVTDARQGDKFFGIDGLSRAFVDSAALDESAIADAVLAAASEAAAGDLRDDAAVLVVKAGTAGHYAVADKDKR